MLDFIYSRDFILYMMLKKFPSFSYSGAYFLIAILVAFSCVWLLSDNQILVTFILLGQAHFLLTYVYAGKYKKINTAYIKKFIALLLLLGGICFFIVENPSFLKVMILIASILFTFHYFNDEFKIIGLEKLENKLLGVLAVVLVASSVFLVKLSISDVGSVLWLIIVSLILTLLFIYQAYKEGVILKHRMFFVFFVLNIIVPICLLFQKNVTIYQVLGFIIVFHYIRWYLYYFDKFKDKDLDYYVNAVIGANLIVLIAFILYVSVPGFGILYLFYSPLFFYAWSIVHILLSLRKHDYTLDIKNIFKTNVLE